MRRWFLAWTGHLLGGLAVVTVFACGYFAWRAARSNYADEMWWSFVTAALLFLLAIVIGAMAAYAWQDSYERWFIRNYASQVDHPIAVGRSGAPEITDPMPGPARVKRPVSEAYNPEKRTLFEEER